MVLFWLLSSVFCFISFAKLKMCETSTSAPTSSPTLAPTSAPTERCSDITVTGTGCSVSVGGGDPCVVQGNCVSSGNFPSDYDPSETCTITSEIGCAVLVSAFNTETCCDKVNVNNVDYTGFGKGLDCVVLTSNAITWSADSSANGRQGWKICFEEQEN